MIIRKGFKNGEVREANKRKFVVPEETLEADFLVWLSRRDPTLASKIEQWPCRYTSKGRTLAPSRTLVLRLNPNANDAKTYGLMQDTWALMPADSRVRHSFKIEYDTPYNRDQW